MFKKFQLKNGMNVLMVESHKSPVVSIQMWVKTGSADELAGEEGISHFIEHLVFKGTRNFQVGEIASSIEGSGGELNAYTSFDQTVFYVTISKQFDETGLEAISEMMGFPAFDAKEIDNEREVVIEEIKRGMDNPHRQGSRALFSSVYSKHPYSVPVIGFEENIRKVSRDVLVDYYKSRYVPENMTLMLVGDFDPTEMEAKVQRYFGGFEANPLRRVQRPQENEQSQALVKVKKTDFEENLFYAAWRVPEVAHEDIAALDVLALIFGQGDSSRLNKALHIQKSIVNFMGSSTFTPQDPGFFAVSASLSYERLSEMLEELNKELYKLLEQAPTAEEMWKAKVNMNSEEFYSLETVDGMARKYGTYEHLFGDFEYFKTFMKRVNSLTAEDIVNVARKYLKPEAMTLVLMTSGDEGEAQSVLEGWVKDYSRTYAEASTKALGAKVQERIQSISWSPEGKKSSRENQVEISHLSSGVRLIMRPNYDTPVVSARCAFMGGMRREPENLTGLTELLTRAWVSGAGDMNEEEVHHKIESLASSLSSFGGRNTVGLTLNSLEMFSKEMFELFSECLNKPHLPEETIEREKQQIYEHLKTRKDNPAQLAILRFLSDMFGDHPYSRDVFGNHETLERIHHDEVKGLYDEVVQANNMTMVVTGHFDPDEWKAMVEKATARLPKGERHKDQFQFNKPSEPIRSFQESKKEQTHIVIGYPGLTFTSPDRYALQVMQSILAGQGGRLFIELRDKESLAYTVAPLRMEGIDAGYFGAYIGCSPEKATKAIEMLKQEFIKLVENRVPEEEIERAKRYLIGRHDIDLQRASTVSASMLFDDIYGVDYNDTFEFAKRLENVTSESLRDLAESIFSQPEVLSVVGTQQPW